MCGGGSPAAPTPTDPIAEARAQIEIENARAANTAAAEARAQALKDQATAESRARADANLQRAYTSTIDQGRSKYAALGIGDGDPYGILSQYQSAVDAAKAKVPTGTEDVASYFSPNLFDDVVNSTKTTQRNKLTGELNQFASDGFADQTWLGTADDSILQSILDTQYTDAMNNLLARNARGSLTGAAYTRALSDLNAGKSGALSKLNAAGDTVLAGYRNDLNTLASNARSRISNWDFLNPYDTKTAKTAIDTRTAAQRSSLEGDIRNAAGGLSLFDADSLVANALAKAGIISTTNGSSNALNTDNNTTTTRTSTNQGVF